ncbi:hypothetical protein [Butyrivibrio sp. AE3009]|uniref:hypothetical protein n=1 Tax=Butyrivibrio sp. AE3009 TaxID=1280666 RepID=UPI0003B72CD7|nr:hypothetical protein [Butyrivibrio sp. AE3009]
MFLHLLRDDEKEAFIDLARLAAAANGSISDEEDIMIEQYCAEMGISLPMSHARTLDGVLACFAESDTMSRKVVIMEIIGLLFSDGDFDEKEMQFIEKIADSLEVSRDHVREMIELTGRYINVLQDILCIIEGE